MSANFAPFAAAPGKEKSPRSGGAVVDFPGQKRTPQRRAREGVPSEVADWRAASPP